MPVGMHRPQPSKWKAVWPFLAILVIVPLLAWGASTLLMQRSTNTADQPPTPQSASQPQSSAQSSARDNAQSDAQSAAESPMSAARQETPQSDPQPSAAQVVNYNAKISVLNGTGTAGLAAQNVATLATSGFPGATAANAEGWITQVSTVYYEDPAMAATAQAVGTSLGISNVQQTAGLGDPDIVVILR